MDPEGSAACASRTGAHLGRPTYPARLRQVQPPRMGAEAADISMRLRCGDCRTRGRRRKLFAAHEGLAIAFDSAARDHARHHSPPRAANRVVPRMTAECNYRGAPELTATNRRVRSSPGSIGTRKVAVARPNREPLRASGDDLDLAIRAVQHRVLRRVGNRVLAA